jgi:histone acetyltransferase (RNA polymerase elongator complex component)
LVERCYFSFVTEYGKVKRSFEEFERTAGVKITNCSEDFKIDLANELSEIAKRHGMRMFSCCGKYLVNGRIHKAHCIDGSVIESLFFPDGLQYREKPTRKECGCTESTDIGTYDTCPHGCVYCYANANKQRAYRAFSNHDKESAFLGYSKSQSDRWLTEIQNGRTEKGCEQLKIWGHESIQ